MATHNFTTGEFNKFTNYMVLQNGMIDENYNIANLYENGIKENLKDNYEKLSKKDKLNIGKLSFNYDGAYYEIYRSYPGSILNSECLSFYFDYGDYDKEDDIIYMNIDLIAISGYYEGINFCIDISYSVDGIDEYFETADETLDYLERKIKYKNKLENKIEKIENIIIELYENSIKDYVEEYSYGGGASNGECFYIKVEG